MPDECVPSLKCLGGLLPVQGVCDAMLSRLKSVFSTGNMHSDGHTNDMLVHASCPKNIPARAARPRQLPHSAPDIFVLAITCGAFH